MQQPQRASEFNSAYAVAILIILFFLTTATFLHGKLLIALGFFAPNPITAEIMFLQARFSGDMWTPAEKHATYIFVAIMTFGILLLSVLALRGRDWYRQYQQSKLVEKRYSSAQGTAQWADTKELKKLMGEDGVIIGYNKKIIQKSKPVRLSLKASCEHVAVIGPTGCGKTSAFFIPNLLQLPDNTSCVVTDPKGEIEATVGDAMRARGWNVVAFCPMDKVHSAVYNPLAIARDDTEIAEVSDIILRNGYSAAGQAGDTQWVNFAQPLWEAALLIEIHKAFNEDRIPTIQGAYDFIISYTESDRADIVSDIGGAALDKYLAYAQSIQSPETAASIKTVVVSSVKLFGRPDVASVTQDGQIFDPSDLRKRPTAFFIQIPERKSSLLKPLSATMYWQIIEHILDLNGCPVVFFLDEFPNIGQIPSFAQLAATVRSRKISLNIGLQGVEQLSREYSEKEQQDIINNMKTKIYYPGSSGESGTYFSNMAGYSTIDFEKQKQRRELMTADELRRIPDGKVAVIAHNLNPVMLDTVPWFTDKKLCSMVPDNN